MLNYKTTSLAKKSLTGKAVEQEANGSAPVTKLEKKVVHEIIKSRDFVSRTKLLRSTN